MSGEYYVFVTPDQTIWGVGQTRKEAVKDAKTNLSDYYSTEDLPKVGKVIRATSELALQLWDSGFDEDMWAIEKNGEMWLAKLKDNNPIDYYQQADNVKETKLKY